MKLLTVSEVAERLRLHEMTVRRHIKSGRLRAIRAGGRIRIGESELDEFMSTGKAHFEMTPEDIVAWARRRITPEEAAARRRVGTEIREQRDKMEPLGMSTATLIRVSRRINEVAYGEKTWEELVAEES